MISPEMNNNGSRMGSFWNVVLQGQSAQIKRLLLRRPALEDKRQSSPAARRSENTETSFLHINFIFSGSQVLRMIIFCKSLISKTCALISFQSFYVRLPILYTFILFFNDLDVFMYIYALKQDAVEFFIMCRFDLYSFYFMYVI